YQDKKGNLRHFMALHFIGCPTKFRVFGPKSTILAVDNRGCCRRWAKEPVAEEAALSLGGALVRL
ncbi:MAG: hypothetical protein NTZ17_15915, partial [Phycisphaerae bacterium]|nr:hypothetical protein [Phycisphaerae bacterium]